MYFLFTFWEYICIPVPFQEGVSLIGRKGFEYGKYPRCIEVVFDLRREIQGQGVMRT